MTEEKILQFEPKQPILSAVIIAREGLQPTIRTIESFMFNTRIPAEIIVVNNATKNDGTKEWLASQKYLKVVTLEGDFPSTYGIALDAGIKIATGKFIVPCNNDLLFTPHWDEYIMMGFEQNDPQVSGFDKIGIISPRTNSSIVPKVQQVEEALLMNSGYNSEVAINFASQLVKYYNSLPNRPAPFMDASGLSGFCWIMSRECYEDVGGFKPTEPLGYEDHEFVRNAIEKGYKTLVSLYSFVHHFGNEYTETSDQGFANTKIDERTKYYQFVHNSIKTDKPKKCVIGVYISQSKKYLKRVMEKLNTLSDDIITFDVDKLDETQKRNEAENLDLLWHECQKLNPDWIMILNGSEILEEKFNRKELENLMNPVDPNTLAYIFRRVTLWDDESHQNQDEFFGNLSEVRLGRNLPNQHIVSNHPLGLSGCLPNYPEQSVKPTRFRIIDHENIDIEDRKKKFEWHKEVTKQLPKEDISLNPYYHLLDLQVPLVKFTPTIKLSLMTIIKDEMRKPSYLVRFLDEYSYLFDEMIFIDTGSKDNSKEVIKQYGGKCIHYSWNDNFSEARNFGLKQCTGDWIFWADPDEGLGDNPERWWKFIENPVLAYWVPILNIMPFPNKPQISRNYRIFKNVEGVTFKKHERVHEGVGGSLNDIYGHGSIVNMPVDNYKKGLEPFPGLIHYGFLRPPNEMQQKFVSYQQKCLDILKHEPTDSYANYSLALHEESMGNDKKAEEYLRTALKSAPNHSQSRASLCHIKAREIKKICMDGLTQRGTNSDYQNILLTMLKMIEPLARPVNNLGLVLKDVENS